MAAGSVETLTPDLGLVTCVLSLIITHNDHDDTWTPAFSWADTKQPPASTQLSLLCPEAAPGHCSAGVMMVQCRHCSLLAPQAQFT